LQTASHLKLRGVLRMMSIYSDTPLRYHIRYLDAFSMDDYIYLFYFFLAFCHLIYSEKHIDYTYQWTSSFRTFRSLYLHVSSFWTDVSSENWTGSPLQDLQKELQDAQQVSAQHFQLELDESTAQINSADALTDQPAISVRDLCIFDSAKVLVRSRCLCKIAPSVRLDAHWKLVHCINH